jgi:hypothetical protein
MSTIEIPNGTLVLPFLGILFSFLSLIISKENKISEFRRAWTDALRQEIAELVGHMNGIQGTLRQKGAGADKWKEARDDVVGLNRCIGIVRMRLNLKEPQAQKVSAILDELNVHFAPKGVAADEEFNRIEHRLLTESQVLLKREWDKVRRGEPFFAATRDAFLIVLTLLAALAVWTAVTRLLH